MPEPAEAAQARFSVNVDLRVELLSIVFRLAGNPEFTDAPDSPYVRDVDRHFAKVRRHSAVIASREYFRKHGIGYNAPMSFAVHLDGIDTLDPIVPLDPPPGSMDFRWQRVPKPQYLSLLRDFVLKSDFLGFVAHHRDYYDRVGEAYRTALGSLERDLDWFDNLYGAKSHARFVVCPMLLGGAHNYSASVRLGDGEELVYAGLGLRDLDARGDVVVDGVRDDEPLLHHELAHAYAGSVVERATSILKPVFSRARDLVKESMSEQGYSGWGNVAEESLVRASTILFLKERRGDAAAFTELRVQEGDGFIWLRVMVEELNRYRSESERYPTVGAFLPRLASSLQRWLELPERQRWPIFRGPIEAALKGLWYARFGVVLVVPNAVDADPQSIAAVGYVKRLHRDIYSRTPIARFMTVRNPERVSAAEAGSRMMLLLGTPQTNPVLGKMLTSFGWRVEHDRIVLGDRVIEGSRLVLFAAKANPANVNVPVVIYAAQRSDDLEGIHALPPGPADWVIAGRGDSGDLEVVASGDFPRKASGGEPALHP